MTKSDSSPGVTKQTILGTLASFDTARKNNRIITQASLQSGEDTLLCLWQGTVSTELITGRQYEVTGVLKVKRAKQYMVQPEIIRHSLATSKTKLPKPKKKGGLLKVSVIFSTLILGITSLIAANYTPQKPSASHNSSTAPAIVEEPVESSQDQQVLTSSQPIDIEKLMSSYNSTYDSSSSAYTFKYDDLNNYFLDSTGSKLSTGSSATYKSGNESWTINCSQYTNTCNAYSSSGGSASTYCYKYVNSCTTYGSDGSMATTNCSNYTTSCNTYGSDGYSSSSYCSQYTNSCSGYDSNGNSSNTYCSDYTSSCSTYGSNGSYSNTYCSRYTTSCSTYGSGGSSSFDW